jgi:hypothetical protein
VTYEDGRAEIDGEYQQALDLVHDFLAGLGNEEIYDKYMQQAYRELGALRARAIEKLDAIWAQQRVVH